MMNFFFCFIFTCFAFGGAGCGTGTDHVEPSPGNGNVATYVISPVSTNSDITKGNDDYYVFAPPLEEAKHKLLVFLAGSLVKPRIYQKLLQTRTDNHGKFI